MFKMVVAQLVKPSLLTPEIRSGQYYKALYDRNIQLYSRNMGCFQVRYDSRVVIYERKLFIRLATGRIQSSAILYALSNDLKRQN